MRLGQRMDVLAVPSAATDISAPADSSPPALPHTNHTLKRQGFKPVDRQTSEDTPFTGTAHIQDERQFG